jgi:hypothetical protein
MLKFLSISLPCHNVILPSLLSLSVITTLITVHMSSHYSRPSCGLLEILDPLLATRLGLTTTWQQQLNRCGSQPRHLIHCKVHLPLIIEDFNVCYWHNFRLTFMDVGCKTANKFPNLKHVSLHNQSGCLVSSVNLVSDEKGRTQFVDVCGERAEKNILT